MSGILNKKNRIIDYKLTENGRKQIQNGDVNFKFYTISDSSIVYNESNEHSGNKISNTEDFYLPFEIASDPLRYINPEFNLTDELDLNTYTDIENLNTESNSLKYVDLNLTNSVTDQIIDLGLLNSKDIVNDSQDFVFKEKFESEEFDFNPEGVEDNSFILSYPTIDDVFKNLNDIKSLKKDLRFSHKRNYKKLPPVNIDGSKLLQEQKSKSVNPLNYIFSSIQQQTNIKINEKRNLAIVKAINSLEKIRENRIFKNYYILNEKSNIKKYFFELHEIKEILGEEISANSQNLTKGLTYKLTSSHAAFEGQIRSDLISLGFDENESEFLEKDFIASGVNSDLINSEIKVKLKNESFKKMAFVDLGSFFNPIKKNNFRVFLIGKVIYNEKSYNEENLEMTDGNIINRNISRDYSFINLFTLVLE